MKSKNISRLLVAVMLAVFLAVAFSANVSADDSCESNDIDSGGGDQKNTIETTGFEGTFYVGSQGVELEDGKTREIEIDPNQWNMNYCSPEDIKGGTAEENAKIALSILEGRETGPRRDAVVINSAAAIYLSGKTEDMASAIPLAEEALNSGAALEKLNHLRTITQEEGHS